MGLRQTCTLVLTASAILLSQLCVSCVQEDKNNHYVKIDYPTRVVCKFQGKDGLIVLDQIRIVDKTRLVEHLGTIDENDRSLVLATLAEMFAE